ncbi:hypothetical protein BBJ28_00014460 [Nothophytophthora sp. Chile5]|nr:hypothetical protein BBJ28_00014460 [Nothophytophthora sp. Chile5]
MLLPRIVASVGARARLLQQVRVALSVGAHSAATVGSSARDVNVGAPSVRFLHEPQHVRQPEPPAPTFIGGAEDPGVAALASASAPSETPTPNPADAVKQESSDVLMKRALEPLSSFESARIAFGELRMRGEKLSEKYYMALLHKASREGRYEQVWGGYEAFLEDEKRGEVQVPPIAATTWSRATLIRQQMHRFVLWALLDARRFSSLTSFYRSNVPHQPNRLGIHESDPLNFLLHLECTVKLTDEQEQGMCHRVEILLRTMELFKFHTSYSAAHALFRIMLRRPEIFQTSVGEKSMRRRPQESGDGDEAAPSEEISVGTLIIKYMNRYSCALNLDSKRLSIAVSAAAAAHQHDATRLLLQHAATHHVAIDAGSFAHAVENAPDEVQRLEIVDMYTHANEHQLVYTTQDANTSIANYLLLFAVFDGNFKHMMELLHEMQLYNNKISNRTASELFESIAQYRMDARQPPDESDSSGYGGNAEADMERKLAECPTIMELVEKFPNAIPRTIHTFSQAILQSLRGGDLIVALELMQSALWTKGIKLRPEIFSQLLYPLLADATGGRRGDEVNSFSEFDRVEVERCFDRQYPGERVRLNALILNICQSNDDLATMLVCLDRWQGQRHPALSRRATQRVFDMITKQIRHLRQGEAVTPVTSFIVDGTPLSYLAFLLRYRGIMVWDAWTIGGAIIRSGSNGLQTDVVALLAEADSRKLVLESAAYGVVLGVLGGMGKPSAVVAYSEKMKADGTWEDTVRKFPKVGEVLSHASGELDEMRSEEDERR